MVDGALLSVNWYLARCRSVDFLDCVLLNEGKGKVEQITAWLLAFV